MVAAARLALARSFRLGPTVTTRKLTATKRSQPLRPWRRGKRSQQPRTNNLLQSARREPGSACSRRASTDEVNPMTRAQPPAQVRSQPAPYVHSNSTHARWGNVSHPARGGVANPVDDSARRARSVGVTSATPPVAEWTTTRRPSRSRPGARSPQAAPSPCASQRGMARPAAHDQQFNQPTASRRRIRLPIRTSAAQPARQAPLNPGLSRWLLPLVPVRTPHRFATTSASNETNARRTTNAPGALRSGAFTMQ